MLDKQDWTDDLKQEVAGLEDYFKCFHKQCDRLEPPYLYHYTSLPTLRKILAGKTLRLYDLLTMKDEEEFRHPLRLVNESVQPHWGGLLTNVTSFFRKRRCIDLGNKWHAFGSCFCEATETPYMWQQYGDDGKGAAIECHATALRADHTLYPMVYNDNWFNDTLRTCHEYVVGRGGVNRFGFKEGDVIGSEYCIQILNLALRGKRECFQGEAEWRALKLLGSTDYQTDDNARRYVEIPLLPKYVSAIVLGPISPMSQEELRTLLDSTCYRQASLRESELSI